MASPVVESITPTTWSSNVTAHNAAMPASVSPGDLLLLFFAADGTPTITTPSGWSIICAKTNAGTGCGVVYGKSAAGTEGGSTVNVQTSSTEQAVAQVYRVTGWGGTLASDVVAATPATGSGVNPDPPSAAWSWGSLDNLVIASCYYSANGNASAAPTNYTDLTSTNSVGGSSGAGLNTARRAMTTAASPENPGVFTFGNATTWVANTVVIKQPTMVTGATVLAGIGALAAAGIRGALGAVSLTGIGTLVAEPAPVVGAVAISGVGTLSAAAAVQFAALAALQGSGTVAAAGTYGAVGSAGLIGQGTLAPAGAVDYIMTAVITGRGTLEAVGTRTAIVIVPARQRPRVYIHDGATLHRIAQLTVVTDLNRSYALREHARTAQFSLALDDPALPYTDPRDAHVVVIESVEYPLPWVGRIIDREGKRADRTLTITADSYDVILGERFLSSNFTTQATSSPSFHRIIAQLNGMNATGIGLGYVEDGFAAPMSLPNTRGIDALNKLAEVAGMEWWLSYSVDGPVLQIFANLARERGADLFDSVVLTGPDGNFEVDGWRQNGKGNAYAQTVISGEAAVTEAFTDRERAVALRDNQQVRGDLNVQELVVEAQRVLRFGHLLAGETSFVAPTQRRELLAVREELKAAGITGGVAQALLDRRYQPSQVISGRAYPDESNTWQYLEPGNVVHLVSGDAFVDGYDGPAVIVGTQPMEHQRFVDLVLEVA